MNRGIVVYVVVAVVLIGGLFFILHRKSEPKIVMSETALKVNELHEKASQLVNSQQLIKARELYRDILTNYPDAENIASVQKELEHLNMELIFSKELWPEKSVMHEVGPGDTIGKIAKNYGTTVELLKKSNNLSGDVIRVGQKLRVWTGHFNVFVDKSQDILILKDGNEVIKVYDVSTGANNNTPVGTFKIISKLTDPVWFNKGAVVPPESPENVLGSRWLGFNIQGYGIHGTVDPETIGQQVTAGCVRMRNKEVEEIYSILPMGTEVVIVD